jgi:hypothetical protein
VGIRRNGVALLKSYHRGTVQVDFVFFFLALPFDRAMRFESNPFAFSSSARREAVSPRPARLMKYVSMRMPELSPLGETFFEASELAMAEALCVNRPFGGWVESVVTFETHLRFFLAVIVESLTGFTGV